MQLLLFHLVCDIQDLFVIIYRQKSNIQLLTCNLCYPPPWDYAPQNCISAEQHGRGQLAMNLSGG